MSLINEALKKAQQVQTESEVESTSTAATPVLSSASSTPSAAESGQSDIFKVLLGVMIFTIIIASFIAFLVISIMQRSSENGQIVVMPQKPESITVTQQPSLTNSINEIKSHETVSDKKRSTSPNLIDSPHNDISTTTNVTALQSGTTLGSTLPTEGNDVDHETMTPIVIVPSIEPQIHFQKPNSNTIEHNSISSDKGRNKPNPATIAYVKQMQIRGIRISDKNSKILMGDRVFCLESTINNELSLRIKEIKPREVILIDSDGFIYSKKF